MNDLLWIGMGILVLVAGILARRGERRGRLSDDLIRQIESTGRIDREDVDPIDVEDIQAHEDDFWSQTWDEPEDLGDPTGWR